MRVLVRPCCSRLLVLALRVGLPAAASADTQARTALTKWSLPSSARVPESGDALSRPARVTAEAWNADRTR